MEYPVLRARDVGHHGLGVVDDHPAWNPAIERQRLRKGIQHHLLGFAGIGHDKGLAAVAQAEMGNLHLLLDTAQDNPFFAPVKLQRIACRKMQRDKGLARTGTGSLQIADKSLNWRIGTGVAFHHELLIERLGRPPLPEWSLLVLIEQLLKPKIKPVAQFVPNRRGLALVARRALILQILLDRVPR